MKDLSMFFLKNTMAAKMRKGFKSFCNGDGSTSTLNQQKKKKSEEEVDNIMLPAVSTEMESSPSMDNDDKQKSITLEEMIMQLDLEEKMARRRREEEINAAERSRIIQQNRRMSCVNSSDILRTARNALSQYPRFSLDGKDAMYRSSFRNFGGPVEDINVGGTSRNTADIVKSRCSSSCRICRYNHHYSNNGLMRNNERRFCTCNHVGYKGIGRRGGGVQQLQPAKIAEDDESYSAVWCKPGVVAKLMGLEAMPIPVLQILNNDTTNNNKATRRKSTSSASGAIVNNFKKQNQLLRHRGVANYDDSARLVNRSGTSDDNYYLDHRRSRTTDYRIMTRKHVPGGEVREPSWLMHRGF